MSFKSGILLLCLFLGELGAFSQNNNLKDQTNDCSENTFNILFYNVENLFDTENDPLKLDDDFTPAGKLEWTPERFQKKIKNIARVITNVIKPEMPDIIGLAEIENAAVLKKLTEAQDIEKAGYETVHYESRDERGIDVALLYNPSSFTVLESRPIRYDLPANDFTRDILYVKGKTKRGNILHLFVNHWPSRSEGTEVSEPKRKIAARALLNEVNKILEKDSKSKIVIMGDFNDDPSDKSVTEVLGAIEPDHKIKNNNLYNLMYPLHNKGEGSLFYNDWNMFDQFIVTGSFFMDKKISCKKTSASIYSESWIMYKDSKSGIMKPNRTYGSRYFGGYSDHLPVLLNLCEEK